MPLRSFDADADQAAATARPIPRGIAFRYEPAGEVEPTIAGVKNETAGTLPDWPIKEIAGLPGWFEAMAPARPMPAPSPAATPSPAMEPVPLGEFWETLRALRATPGVKEAAPLLLLTGSGRAGALGFGQEQYGLWGWPYDRETLRKKEEAQGKSDWHLTQLRVRQAWAVWRDRQPGKVPGEGILVAHPDTGYSDHAELTGRLRPPGRSFLRDEQGNEEADARDDLRRFGDGFLAQPGHGTATASVIASTEEDPAGSAGGETYGVAPGATVLPLRVSRTVVHFDFGNVGKAVLHAVAERADVISMSLGGPGSSAFLQECIRAAHQQGVIVVAAAGNLVPTTVFPAAFPEVVAVAATHAADAPWRYSGLGRTVDIAAPGEEVWCARASLAPDGQPLYQVGQGTGTSFATACVAGLAALWLSYHGGRDAIAQKYGGRKELVPFAFHYLLTRTANSRLEFVRGGRHGAGIADAEALLRATLPDQAEVQRFRDVILGQESHRLSVVTGLLTGWLGVAERAAATLTLEATLDPDGQPRSDPVAGTEAVTRAAAEVATEAQLLRRLLGDEEEELAEELVARIAADPVLLAGFQRWRPGESLLPLFARLLPPAAQAAVPGASQPELSAALAQRLKQHRDAEAGRLQGQHRGQLVPGVSTHLPQATTGDGMVPGPPPPHSRLLRAYAFDPSQETKPETAPISQVTIPTRWERIEPGPIGEYLEVVDVDPASGCVYSPVDLDHPHLLAQDGLPPSEGSPQFHQQMVYAVAMNTINRFELALGRPIFWAPLRPWLRSRPEEQDYVTPEARRLMDIAPTPGAPLPREEIRDRYVQRLRIYPHALREANAYYSPAKRALLFGYFPAADDDTGRHYPGGMVFTCLSHDIIAHETTHALLDGMHPFFNEPSNEDVWAFHEAFADIVALFQHFTYPEVLRHQIANTRGDLRTNNLLGQLAQQFGEATGNRGALRNTLGKENARGEWERTTPDPRRLATVREPHERGSILVTAVFDAFLTLYNARIEDLLRLSSGGSGVLPAGQIHPDLVNRLADEAAQTAEEVLRVCIRALDYVPPVDITFGEFLRALITADYDLAPTDRRPNRIAFIDAFRSWGIYPRDVPTLSEESLRWRRPGLEDGLTNLAPDKNVSAYDRQALDQLVPTLELWQPRADRDDPSYDARGEVFRHVLRAQGVLHELLEAQQSRLPPDRPLLPGLDLRRKASFSVSNLRPARRTGTRGEFRTEMVVEVVQTYQSRPDAVPFRGGATLVVDLRTWEIRYVIYKRLYERLPKKPDSGGGLLSSRYRRQQAFQQAQEAGVAGVAQAVWRGEEDGQPWAALAATYASAESMAARRADEPFALIHRSGG